MKRLLWWAIFLLCLGGITTAYAQHYPRFHRYALTRLDETTALDMVKDAASGRCRLVYRAQIREGYTSSVSGSVAVTYLGEVPCDPIPVLPIAEVR